MSETTAMQERYRLEREQILLNSKLSQEQKLREIALSKALQEEENRKRLNSAVQQWGGIQAEMNGTGDQYALEQQRFSRYDASQQVFDAQIGQVEQAAQDPNANMEELAAQREAIWQAHHDRMTAIESDYYTNSQALQLAGMGQVASGLSSIVGDMAGEQSSAYKAMFAIEKGFAIAQSALAIQTGVSKAIALGFPQNIPVIAQTVMEGAKIASAIRAITDTGFANGGYTGYGGKYEPAGVVHKG
ncbi:MAG: phage tail tape measure protein, partial [Cyanobacteriota bacterium]